jgi:hypothetical protein
MSHNQYNPPSTLSWSTGGDNLQLGDIVEPGMQTHESWQLPAEYDWNMPGLSWEPLGPKLEEDVCVSMFIILASWHGR